MVTETLVEPLIESGRELIDQYRVDGNSVEAAFWLKPVEEGNWYLYLVTKTMASEGPIKSYRKLYTSWSKLQKSFVSLSEVKLIDTNDPVAKSVAELVARYGGNRLATWVGPTTLGIIAAEKIYIYRQ